MISQILGKIDQNVSNCAEERNGIFWRHFFGVALSITKKSRGQATFLYWLLAIIGLLLATTTGDYLRLERSYSKITGFAGGSANVKGDQTQMNTRVDNSFRCSQTCIV